MQEAKKASRRARANRIARNLYQAVDAFSRFLDLAGASDPRVAAVKRVLEAIR